MELPRNIGDVAGKELEHAEIIQWMEQSIPRFLHLQLLEFYIRLILGRTFGE
jgi:hypothetical protein